MRKNELKMYCQMFLVCFLFSQILLASSTSAFHYFKQGHPTFQLGGYYSSQGKEQHINIATLIGDEFTVENNHGSHVFAGFGYFIDGQENAIMTMAYGINAFFLAPTSIYGRIVQENLFTNLSYDYKVRHIPIYILAKSTINTQSPSYSVTIDVGLGPNFMTTSSFQEHSLDGGITIPDNAFSDHTSTTFSATSGINIQFNDMFDKALFACGYRFFFLGQGRLQVSNSQILNTLTTGDSYANAVMCSITV